ncbi:MAG TPA: hypothetical protein VIJ46_03615 [Rhabdochlamydiaceae bacterium]
MSRTTFNLQSSSTFFSSPPSLEQRCETFLASSDPSSYEELNGFLGQSPSAIRILVSLVQEALNSVDQNSLQTLLSHPQLKAHFHLANEVLFLSWEPMSASVRAACFGKPGEDLMQFPLTGKAKDIVAEFLS